jgi:hypothetical protein
MSVEWSKMSATLSGTSSVSRAIRPTQSSPGGRRETDALFNVRAKRPEERRVTVCASHDAAEDDSRWLRLSGSSEVQERNARECLHERPERHDRHHPYDFSYTSRNCRSLFVVLGVRLHAGEFARGPTAPRAPVADENGTSNAPPSFRPPAQRPAIATSALEDRSHAV